MPLTGYGGNGGSDWLQSLLASFGAGQPYDPSQNPSLTPNAGMPGGGVMGAPAATPGAPSMGYPAVGQPGAQPQPAAAPAPSNPFMRALGYLNPIGSAQADVLHPSLGAGALHPSLTAQPSAPSSSPLLRAGAADSLPLAFGNVTSDDYQKWLMAQQQGGAPAPSPPAPAGPATYPHMPWPGSPQAATYPHMPWPDTGASKAAAVANAPSGNPSATPRPAAAPKPAAKPSSSPSSNSRFGTVQYQVPSGSGGPGGPLSRNPIYTSLNLFGGRS